jgi:hypothetical protein
MSLAITTSPDITLLDFAILYDLSTGVPSITLTNRSIGNPSGTTNLANCKWWYTITTPSGVYIHEGSELVPDVNLANWTTLTIPSGAWPTPFGEPPYGQVEFSCGVPYIATLYVKDSASNIFSLDKRVTICRPPSNTENTLGNFGAAGVQVTVKCDTASVVANDTTNYTYQSRSGSYAGNTWTFAFPMNDSGTIPAPLVVTGEGRVFFPVGYSAEGYQLYMNSLQTYDMGDYQTIKLQYKFKSVFPIWCNVSLCEAYCQLEALQAQLEKNCGDVENPNIQKKIDKVQGLIQQAMMGIMQPGCGIDVPAIIEEIKKIGGAKCNCSGMTGINPIAGTDGAINLTTSTTGAITAVVTNTGNNYNIALAVPGSSAGTLQQVTDNGNITTNNMIVGASAALHQTMEPGKTQVYRSGTQVLAGFGQAAPGDSEGSLWVRSVGSNGTVYLRASALGVTYVMVMPTAQGSAGETLLNDGSGNLSWGSAVGDLQIVTDNGSVTTNDINVGNTLAKYGHLSDEQIALFNAAAKVAALENDGSDGGVLILKASGLGFAASLKTQNLGANRLYLLPGFRSGTVDLVGDGVAPGISAGAGAGTTGSVSLSPGSDDKKGIIIVNVSSGATANSVVATLTYNTTYSSAMVVPIIQGIQGVAAQLSGTSQVAVTSGLASTHFNITAGTTPLAAGLYGWYYSVQI